MNIYMLIGWVTEIPHWGWLLIGYGIVWTVMFFLPRRFWKRAVERHVGVGPYPSLLELLVATIFLWWMTIPFAALGIICWLVFRLWLIVHPEEPNIPYKPKD